MKHKTLEHFPRLKRSESYTVKKDGTYYTYTWYRDEIRKDSLCRCVYCDTYEDNLGGSDMMQLDHFRPQAIFPELKNDPNNLVLACARCNLLKREDWISQKSLALSIEDGKGYIDPFLEDRHDFFEIGDYGKLLPKREPAEYMIQKLALNRRFLALNRAKLNMIAKLRTYSKKKLKLLNQRVKEGLKQSSAEDHIRDLEIYTEIINLLIDLYE